METLAQLGELARAGTDPETIATTLNMDIATVHSCLRSPGVRASFGLNIGVDGIFAG